MKASIASAVLAYLSVVASQGVTSKITAPGAAPSGCAASQNGVFGIQIVAAGSTPQKRAVSQIGDGQIQAATTTAAAKPVSQIGDGQVQAATSTAAAKPVTQISDGQIQAATKTAAAAVPVSQIGDGQIQAATSTAARMVTVTVTKNNCVASPITQISDGQIQAPMATPVTQINDGQIQAPTAKSGVAVSQITDGQIQAATKTAAAVSQITDGQIQAKSGTTLATSVKAAVPTTAATNAAGYAILPGAAQACASSSTLQLKLNQGVLTDAKNRTGYVAANYQFQFDGPPQTGAIYTAGFSLCSNGTLALGGEAFFYQCLSGTFYNLYYYPQGYKVPAQCQAIQIEAIQLNSC